MDKLTEIMNWKRQEVASRIRPIRKEELSRWQQYREQKEDFRGALEEAPGLGLIAEIKRKSPSAGEIASLPEAVEQARRYYNADVDAISVLTDEKYFGGSMRDLWEVNEFMEARSDPRPTLRKDFFFHPMQVVEAAEAGAAAILIIVRALSDEEIHTLYDYAECCRLDSLFEVHTEAELERALRFEPDIIGVNNRDLTRFVTDLSISEALIPQIPEGILKISESGILGLEDAERAYEAGADAVLVGEALMKMEEEEQERFVSGLHSIEMIADE